MPIRRTTRPLDISCVICGKLFSPRWQLRSKYCNDPDCKRAAKLKCSREDYLNNRKQKLIYSDKLRNTNPLEYIYGSRRYQAQKRGTPFEISIAEIIVPDTCPVFGTKFVRKTASAMSLDRINNDKGYIKGNVQVLSRKANQMKSNATPEELLKFADWVYATYR